MNVIEVGSRLEPMVDECLIERLENAALKLHHPQARPLPAAPLVGGYATVIKDGDRYRAWYRATDPTYRGEAYDGNPGEISCYAESVNGIDWDKPVLGLHEVEGSRDNNVVLAEPPFCHNCSPMLDMRPGAPVDERFKALAGLHDHGINAARRFAPNAMLPDVKGGLYAFASPDGIHWRKLSPEPAIPSSAAGGFGFDSQNVSFWSEAEGCYVCYFRTWQTPDGRPSACAPNSMRSVSRCTSADYLNWSDPVALCPNEPGEHLYTTQTHPYFRAPHIYIATPTRFMNERGDSTDILFMTARGAAPYARPFKEAWIRPGLDPERWGNRANYLALNVVPTSPDEMSLYHDHSGIRYILRTDGFASVHAGAATGEMLTRPLAFSGRALTINYSTAAAGAMRVELQRADGRPLPGLALEDCPPFWGDAIEHTVTWKGGADLSALAGQPVRLRFVMKEADLFSLRFGKEIMS